MLQLVTLKHEASGGHVVVANYHMPCMCGAAQRVLACQCRPHARCRFLYPEVAAHACLNSLRHGVHAGHDRTRCVGDAGRPG